MITSPDASGKSSKFQALVRDGVERQLMLKAEPLTAYVSFRARFVCAETVRPITESAFGGTVRLREIRGFGGDRLRLAETSGLQRGVRREGRPRPLSGLPV